MARLDHSELKALSDALLALYSPGPHADFPARVFAVLRRSLLKPHLSQALTASKLFSYYSDAAEGDGQAWIVANSASMQEAEHRLLLTETSEELNANTLQNARPTAQECPLRLKPYCQANRRSANFFLNRYIF